MSLDGLYVPAPPRPSQETGRLDRSAAIREALADLMAEAKGRTEGRLDRFALAAEMSRLAGRDMTKNMLDRYAAPSADEWRFPLEALPALTAATGDYRLLDLVAEACGCRVLRGEEAVIAELAALLIQESDVRTRINAIKKQVPDELLRQLEQRARERATGGSS